MADKMSNIIYILTVIFYFWVVKRAMAYLKTQKDKAKGYHRGAVLLSPSAITFY
jgi:hypothetical protein